MAAKRVLIVDDCEVIRQMVRLTLEHEGFRVSALSGVFGLTSTIREERPDVILLDVSMPALDGDRIVSILKQHEFSRDIPVLLYSDLEEAKLRSLAAATGADGFARKSSGIPELIKSIEALPEIRRSEDLPACG